MYKCYKLGDRWYLGKFALGEEYKLHVDFEVYRLSDSWSSLEDIFTEKQAHGSVKWDSCSNFEMADEDGYLHTCSREELINLGTLLGRIFDQCAEMLGDKFDGDDGHKPVVDDGYPKWLTEEDLHSAKWATK